MKNQAVFSSKDKSKKLKCHLLQFLFGTLRFNFFIHTCFVDIYTELQIRGGTEDNSKIIFLFLNENICCDPSLELSQ